MRCVNELIDGGTTASSWHALDTEDWQRGYVWCPLVGNKRTVFTKNNPPSECVRRFEHAVAAGMTHD